MEPIILAKGWEKNYWRIIRGDDGKPVEQCSDSKDGPWQPGRFTDAGRGAHETQAAIAQRRIAPAQSTSITDAHPAGLFPASGAGLGAPRFPWWQIALASALGAAVPIAAHLLHLWGF